MKGSIEIIKTPAVRYQLLRHVFFVIMGVLIAFNCLAQREVGDEKAAESYLLRAVAFHKSKNYDSALLNANKALFYYNSHNEFNEQAKCYNLISKCYFENHRYEDAFIAVGKVIGMSPDYILPNDVEMGYAYLNMGLIHEIKSNVDSSIYFNKKAVEVFKGLPGHKSDLAEAYRQIGGGYRYNLDYENGLIYYKMSLNVIRSLYGENSLQIVRIYNNIANVLIYLYKSEAAEEYLFRSLDILTYLKGDFWQQKGYVYARLSDANVVRGETKGAIEYMKKAEMLLHGHVDSHQSIVVYRNLGILLLDVGEYDSAKLYLRKALGLAEGFFGPKHPANASILFQIGVLFDQMGNYNKSISAMHKSVIANIPDFDNADIYSNPIVRGKDFDKWQSIRSLEYKGRVFRKAYDESGDLKFLKASLDAYMVSDSLLTNTRQERRALADKIQLSKFATDIYGGSIGACLEMYNRTNNIDFKHLSFSFSEKAKSGVMMETLGDLSAKNDGEIPGSLLDLESEIKEKRSLLQSKVLGRQQDGNADGYEQGLFDVNTKSDSLMSFFEETYPAYYELKYKNKIENVLSLQDKISPKTVVFEFFEGEDSVYLFAISKLKYQIYHFPNDSIYSSAIEKLRNSLNQGKESQSAPDNYGNFVQSSSFLYSLLLEKTLIDFSSSAPIDELIIIPDGQMHSLPFDILITKKPTQEGNDYRNLNYLIKYYVVNYGYSSTLSFDTPNRKTTSNSYLGFAPEYVNSVDSSQLQSLGKFRDEIMPLKWNQHEVMEVSNIVGGDYYLAGDATEAIFKSEANNCQIIHMAMHTLINDEDPMNSKFVFTLGKDSIEDGFLHAFELYNMQLNANLAVLSACNTGLGKLSRGEGAMSLARGFRYTGVPNLIMSLWQVSDLPTSELMILFYQELDKGVSYAEALRNAKLKYLESSDMVTSNPFYWGAFVFIGEPVSLHEKSNFWIWLLVGVLFVGVLWRIVNSKRLSIRTLQE